MKVGEVDDFVADEDGIINYVIVRHGGSVFGLGSKLTPVPWRIATLDDINHIVSIGTGKGKFMGAPIIMGNNWSRFDDPDWNMEIRDYFNK
jgi:hypothetical protein